MDAQAKGLCGRLRELADTTLPAPEKEVNIFQFFYQKIVSFNRIGLQTERWPHLYSK